MIKKISVSMALAVMLLAAQYSYAREVRFEVSVDRSRVAIGESIQAGLTFYEERGIPVPDLGKLDGFDVRYVGPSTMMTVINGKMSSSITYMYSLVPLRVGKFTLGPFTFDYRGDKYTSNMAPVEVTEEKQAPVALDKRPEPIIDTMRLDDKIFLTLRAGKANAYVNELVPVKVKLYVKELNVSDIQLPTFGQEGFSKADFKEPKQYKEQMAGVVYDVLEFNTGIFGTRPGDYKLGPAKIKCNIMVKKSSAPRGWTRDNLFEDDFFNDFLTRFERHPVELESSDAPLTVSPLPESGRPPSFSGAVGDYQFIFSASPKNVRVGDPVTLNMEINGTGNFNTVLVPELDNTDGFRVYDPEIKTEDHRKTFKVVLIPETDKATATPKAIFSYFDPDKKQFRTISQGPAPIVIEKGRAEAPAQVVGLPAQDAKPARDREELTRDIIYIKESPGKLAVKGRSIFNSALFLGFMPVPLLFLAVFSVIEARRARLRTDSAYAGRLSALKAARRGIRMLKDDLRSNDTKRFYESLFKALQGYLGNRLDLPTAGITSDIIESVLAPREIDLDIARKIRALFDACDRARFAFMDEADFKMHSDLKELQDIIKYFERVKI